MPLLVSADWAVRSVIRSRPPGERARRSSASKSAPASPMPASWATSLLSTPA
jgi:hypothetical protein